MFSVWVLCHVAQTERGFIFMEDKPQMAFMWLQNVHLFRQIWNKPSTNQLPGSASSLSLAGLRAWPMFGTSLFTSQWACLPWGDPLTLYYPTHIYIVVTVLEPTFHPWKLSRWWIDLFLTDAQGSLSVLPVAFCGYGFECLSIWCRHCQLTGCLGLFVGGFLLYPHFSCIKTSVWRGCHF